MIISFRKIVFSILLCFLLSTSNAQLIKDSRQLADISRMLPKQKELAIGRYQQLFGVFDTPLSADEKQALEFLYAYMPLSDLADYEGKYFLNQVKAVMKARSEMAWGNLIPEDIFLHFVLPPRVNNENLDEFRVLMYDELKQRVGGMSLHDAILEVNHWCHEKVTYRGSDERTSSPLASLKTSFGRCGEESTFTVTALRTLGIPARQVYTPRWAHSDDNHAWVEVWVDGKWYFLGACEPDPELNMGWFAEPARRAMLVHTRAYGSYYGNETVIDKQEKFAELNLTANYAITGNLVVKVIDELNNPVESAQVEYQLYNYAEFYPIAKGKTDKVGFSSLVSGLGDLIVYVYKDNMRGFKKVTIGSVDTLEIAIKQFPDLSTQKLDLVPPIEKTPLPPKASPEQIAVNAKMILLEDSIRISYMSTFRDSSWVAEFTHRLKLDEKRVQPIFRKSYGNWREIADFLAKAPINKQDWAIRLLECISEKDIRDTKSDILMDHLANSFNYNNYLSSSNPDLFAQYLLNGRIANEMMLPWRKFLQEKFGYEFTMQFKADPSVLIDCIKKNILLDNQANLHSRAPLSPRGVFEIKVADKRSRDIFFVAVCRSLGQAARLNTETSIPQYLFHNEWVNVIFDSEDHSVKQKSMVTFISTQADLSPKYAINFTIARLENGVYRTVDFDYGKPLTSFTPNVEVVAGSYMLISGNRQSDGSVLSEISFFEAPAGKSVEVSVELREELNQIEPWGKLPETNINLIKFSSNESVSLSALAKNKNSIFIWIEPDKEPTKHVMADLPSVSKILENNDVNLFFLLSQARISKAFSIQNYSGLPQNSQFAIDKNDNFLKTISTIRKQPAQFSFPVIVIVDKQENMVYYSEGYKIGIGEQLAKQILKLK